MVFRRRDRRPIWRFAIESVYPRGGWVRAAHYIKHRLRRLPDEPERIARGVFAGLYVSFTPFFGFHFLSAAGLALLIRGNIIAALLATFIVNPVTTPPLAWGAVELGHWMLGTQNTHGFNEILGLFGGVSEQLWHNVQAIFTPRVAEWDALQDFYSSIFLPYLVGGLILGLPISLAFYFMTLPLIRAYQHHRVKKLAERIEKARLKKEKMMRAAEAKAEARAERQALKPEG